MPLARGRELDLGGRLQIMGVVNITPDSFSDGGRWFDPAAAIDHGLTLLEAGADMIDLGAESTRPGGGVYGDGAATVPAAEELRRLLPVLIALRQRTDAVLSIDTRKADVARVALAEGADLINDISALSDPDMASVVATSGCAVVLMHARGDLASMQRSVHFTDVVSEVEADLVNSIETARAAGIGLQQIVLDPGIGFGKRTEHNVALLAATSRLAAIGPPLLIGASRKSFIGDLTGAGRDERLPGSLAAAHAARRGGAALLRVHDVGATVQFFQVLDAIEAAA